jgi:multiple sugar transport system substrate-binding protein
VKRIYPVLCFLVVFMLLAACAPAAPAPQPTAVEQPTQPPADNNPAQPAGKLRVWIQWGDNPAQLQSLFDKYAKANNLQVEVNAPVEPDKIIAALTGSEPPDVIVLSGGDNVKSLAHEGVVLQLNDIIQTSGIDMNDIYPAPLIQCKEGDQIWCLPWGTDVYALFWNKDLFEEAGLDPEKPPQSMEELAEYAKKLTKKDANGNLTQVGFIPDFSWGHTDLYARMMGGYWYSDDGTKITANSQPMLDALKWEQQFYCDNGADQVLKFTSAMGDYMSPDQGFYAGKIAMMVDGEWQVGPNFIPKFKPELSYGVAPFPAPKSNPERAGTVVTAGSVALIPAGVKDKAAAAKLLGWMMSPDILAEEMVANSNLPTSRKAAEDQRFKDIKHFDVFIQLMGGKNASGAVTTPVTVEFGEKYGQVEEQILHTCAAPGPLLDSLQKEFEPKLAEALNKK